MLRNLMVSVLVFSVFVSACAKISEPSSANSTETVKSSGGKIETEAKQSKSIENKIENSGAESSANKNLQTKQPKTVREFFNILPQKYFLLEGCEPEKDKNCEKARAEYVKTYLEVEDTKNGYWKSSCDGGQSCLEMALFKRPDSTYTVAVHTLSEAEETNYFLDCKDGKWTDISSQVVPEFSAKNIYQLPRYGTTVEVFKKNFPEPDFSERGEKIYELEWKEGKFFIKK